MNLFKSTESESAVQNASALTRRGFIAALALAAVAVPCAAFAAESGKTEEKADEAKADEKAAETEAAEETTAEGGQSEFVQKKLAEIEEEIDKQLPQIPEADPDAKIGILISSTSNEFWATMKSCYEDAAEQLGINIQIFEAASETDTTGQLDTLNTMVGMGFDVIIASPIDGTNLIPGVVAANEAGIPVINLGPGINLETLEAAGGHIDGKITVSFSDQGKTAAEDLVSRIPEGGEVAIIAGLSGAAQSEGRASGAAEVFEATEGVELVANQACDWDTTKAYEATKDILTAHPDLKGIFACNDNMALAAVQALQEMGKTDVLTYGVDFTSAAKAAMQEGTMTGSLTYSSAISTKTVEKMALILHQGGELPEAIYNPLVLVTKETVNDYEGWR